MQRPDSFSLGFSLSGISKLEEMRCRGTRAEILKPVANEDGGQWFYCSAFPQSANELLPSVCYFSVQGCPLSIQALYFMAAYCYYTLMQWYGDVGVCAKPAEPLTIGARENSVAGIIYLRNWR